MSGKQIKYGAIISYVAIFFNIAAGLIYTPWMVRQIGVSDYGLYTLIGAFLSYFLIDFGLSQSIARFIAKFKAEDNQEKINNLLGITTRIYLLIDFVIVIVLIAVFFLLPNIFGKFTVEELEKFKVIYIIAGFFSVMSFPLMPVNGALIAYERFIVLKLSDLLQKVVTIVLMVIVLLNGYGLFTLVFVNGFIGFGVKLFNYLYVRKKEKIKINFNFVDKTLAKSLFAFSAWIFVIGIAQRFKLNIVPTILGAFSGTEEIAIFSVAMILEGYTFTFAQALNGLFLPKVTRMITANDDRKEVSDLMIKVGRLQFMVIGLLIAGIVVLGKPFISLWMGEYFVKSYYVALLLIVPLIITLTQEIASTLMFVLNEIKYRAILYVLASLLSVTIGIILAPKYGAIGTGFGVGASLVVFDVVAMNIVYAKILKLEIKRFFISVHLKMFFPLLVSSLACVILQYFHPISSWFSFFIIGSLFVLIYFLLSWNKTMNQEEKNLVLKLVRRK